MRSYIGLKKNGINKINEAIHYNSDLSGDIMITGCNLVTPIELIREGETVDVKISSDTLKNFLAFIIREKIQSKIEDMDTDDIFKLLGF